MDIRAEIKDVCLSTQTGSYLYLLGASAPLVRPYIVSPFISFNLISDRSFRYRERKQYEYRRYAPR